MQWVILEQLLSSVEAYKIKIESFKFIAGYQMRMNWEYINDKLKE